MLLRSFVHLESSIFHAHHTAIQEVLKTANLTTTSGYELHLQAPWSANDDLGSLCQCLAVRPMAHLKQVLMQQLRCPDAPAQKYTYTHTILYSPRTTTEIEPLFQLCQHVMVLPKGKVLLPQSFPLHVIRFGLQLWKSICPAINGNDASHCPAREARCHAGGCAGMQQERMIREGLQENTRRTQRAQIQRMPADGMQEEGQCRGHAKHAPLQKRAICADLSLATA